MKIILKINHYIGKAEAVILAYHVIAMAMLLIANVFCRLFLDFSITFTEELCKFFLITITFLGVSYTLRHNNQVEMTTIIELLPPKVLRWVRIGIQLLTGLILLAIAVVSVQYVQSVQELNRVTPSLQLPVWITLVGLPVGMFLGGCQSLIAALRNLLDQEKQWVGSEVAEGESAGLSTYDLPDN